VNKSNKEYDGGEFFEKSVEILVAKLAIVAMLTVAAIVTAILLILHVRGVY